MLTPVTNALNGIAGTGLGSVPKRYYGKYRGKVADNMDPLFLGRIMAIVPALGGEEPLTWAMPCTPYAGMEVGLYAIPPVDANVWIEFEGGDPSFPIWTGCFWEEGQTPLEAPTPAMKIFKTECITLIINDEPEAGGITLEVTPPAVGTPISITIDSEGIQIETEATIEVTSQEINVTSESISVEAGETNITGNVGIEGAVEIEGDVNITGAEEIEGDVNVVGAVEIEGDVNVLGATQVEGDVAIVGAAEIAGDVAIAGGAEVVGVLLAPIINGGVPLVI